MKSENRFVYGIHSATPYDRQTKMPFGSMLVLGSTTLAQSTEKELIFGGSNRNPWASEAKTTTSELTLITKTMPDFLFELFLGAEVIKTVASATGTVTSIQNKFGLTVVDAVAGIDSVVLKAASDADLKTGTYVIKAISPTTVHVYALNDIEIQRGADLELLDDDSRITDAALVIAQGVSETIPSLGIELVGGSGVIAMVIGDTAVFRVASPHNGISEINLGKDGSSFPEFGMSLFAEKTTNGDMFEIEVYKASGSGFPIALTEKTYSIPELTITPLYDEVEKKTTTIRAIKG